MNDIVALIFEHAHSNNLSVYVHDICMWSDTYIFTCYKLLLHCFTGFVNMTTFPQLPGKEYYA